ncbi:MAG: hypothetical protein J5978_00660 [Spirochaetaceae bacterium]|nr:hypothetical protein [Spirochaetaceae bacterium]
MIMIGYLLLINKETNGNTIGKKKKFIPVDYIDPYWGGCTEEYAKKRMKELENGINVL